MSQYHPDRTGGPADPQFLAMHSHYEHQTSHFTEALFSSFDAAGFIALESDMADFWQSLWKRGFKIVSINEPLEYRTKEKSSLVALQEAKREIEKWVRMNSSKEMEDSDWKDYQTLAMMQLINEAIEDMANSRLATLDDYRQLVTEVLKSHPSTFRNLDINSEILVRVAVDLGWSPTGIGL